MLTGEELIYLTDVERVVLLSCLETNGRVLFSRGQNGAAVAVAAGGKARITEGRFVGTRSAVWVSMMGAHTLVRACTTAPVVACVRAAVALVV
jgi:hypothetical protein